MPDPMTEETTVSDPMTRSVTEEELADQCQHVCLKPDGHEGPHFYGYRLGPWSQAELVAEVRQLRDKLEEAQLRSIEARHPGIDMEYVKRERALIRGDEDG